MKNLIALALSGLLAAAAAGGTTYTYVGTDGVWGTASNWSPSGVPGAGDTAKFTANATMGAFDLSEGVTTISEDSGVTVKMGGVIGGAGALVHDGKGTLSLGDANTFTGPFTNLAGTVSANKVANGGQPSSFGAGYGTIYFKTITWSYNGTSETDRSIYYPGGQWNLTGSLTMNGHFAGGFWFRNNGTMVFNSQLGTDVTSVSRTDAGVVKFLHPSNLFTCNPSLASGTYQFVTLSNKNEICSMGCGTSFSFGQSGYPTPGTFTYLGTDQVFCDRAITINSCHGKTSGYPAYYERYDGPTFLTQNAGAKVTYTGAIALGNADAVAPFIQCNGAGDTEFTAAIPVRFHFRKLGTGTCTLSGANAATGICTVAAGRLDLNGSYAAGARLDVLAAATLGGTGVVHAATTCTANSLLTAGTKTACGALTFDNPETPLVLNPGSILSLKIGADTNDVIHVAGSPGTAGSVLVRIAPLSGSSIPPGVHTLMTWDAMPATSTFVLDGVADGVLTATEHELKLTVGADNLVWKGDGAANVWDASAPNWAGNLVYSDGITVSFTDAGSDDPAVRIASTVAPLQVNVAADEKNYVFTGGKITGACGIAKSGAGTLTLANDNDFTGALVVREGLVRLDGRLDGATVTSGDEGQFYESPTGCIAGEGLVLSFGLGQFSLLGTNTFTGTIAFDARGKTTSGLHAFFLDHAGSLGNATDFFIYPHNHTSEGNATYLRVTNDVVVPATTTLWIGRNASVVESFLQIPTSSRSTLTWRGDVRVVSGSGSEPNITFRAEDGASVMNIGTLGETEISDFYSVSFRGGGTRRVYSRFRLGTGGIGNNDSGTTEIYSVGNEHGNIGAGQGTWRLCTNEAFAASAILSMGKDSRQWGGTHSGQFDLNGFNQTLAGLQENSIGFGGSRIVTSSKPATLTIRGTANCSFGSPETKGTSTGGGTYTTYGRITGAVALVKDGASTLTLNALNTFTGGVTVCGGTLTANAAAALGAGAKLLDVTGGTLALAAAESAPEEASVRLAANDGTGGVIDLAAGVNQTVQYLTIGDREMPADTYGSPDSSAKRKLACFTGTGILTVRHGASGLSVIFR